ncbi:hypothetical protein V5O39_32325 (plasmid) [Pseudomonas parakoreensis]
MYLFYRVRLAIDGSCRVIQVFDEFAQYLDDPYMDVEVKRGLKTDRKRTRSTSSPRRNQTTPWKAGSAKRSCSSASPRSCWKTRKLTLWTT